MPHYLVDVDIDGDDPAHTSKRFSVMDTLNSIDHYDEAKQVVRNQYLVSTIDLCAEDIVRQVKDGMGVPFPRDRILVVSLNDGDYDEDNVLVDLSKFR